MDIATTRCSLGKQVSWFSLNLRALDWENAHRLPYTLTAWKLRTSYQRLPYLNFNSGRKQYMNCIFWKTHSMPVDLEESSSLQSEDALSEDEHASEDSPEQLLAKPLSSDELKSLLADSERVKLTRKLSEANQQNRFLKRQLHIKEDALVNFKSELAVMELEIQALVSLAEEISKSGIPEGSRKINGRYVQSHLYNRLEVVHKKLKEQIKDVDAAQSKEVLLFWCGMAEAELRQKMFCPGIGAGVAGCLVDSYSIVKSNLFCFRVYKLWGHLMGGVKGSTYHQSTLVLSPSSQPPYCSDPEGMKSSSWWMESGSCHQNTLPLVRD